MALCNEFPIHAAHFIEQPSSYLYGAVTTLAGVEYGMAIAKDRASLMGGCDFVVGNTYDSL
jgi:hypothetical protein